MRLIAIDVPWSALDITVLKRLNRSKYRDRCGWADSRKQVIGGARISRGRSIGRWRPCDAAFSQNSLTTCVMLCL